jgi:hypothetical protein
MIMRTGFVLDLAPMRVRLRTGAVDDLGDRSSTWV